MRITLVAVVLGLGCVVVAQDEVVQCMSNSDCTADQCCFRLNAELEVSKRGDEDSLLDLVPAQEVTKGVCQNYLSEGDSCDIYAKQNGYCGCNDQTGYTCEIGDTDGPFLEVPQGTCQQVLLDS